MQPYARLGLTGHDFFCIVNELLYRLGSPCHIRPFCCITIVLAWKHIKARHASLTAPRQSRTTAPVQLAAFQSSKS